MLLLHLQGAFGLEVYQIALVYLPGGIVLTMLPRMLHRFVQRYGRRAGYVAASIASALTAAGLAFSPAPLAIAALWVLTSVSWALLLPMYGEIAAELNPRRLGRAMSILGNAGLLGAAIGSLLAGFLYAGGSWQAACLVFAAILLAGSVLGPLALAKMGIRDRPAPDAANTPRELLPE